MSASPVLGLAPLLTLPPTVAANRGTTKCEACADGCGTTTHCERAHYTLLDGSGDIILARQPSAREGGGPR